MNTDELVVSGRESGVTRYVYKQRPYRHQVLALRKLLANEWGGALLMSPRTGKTKVAIDFWSIKFKQRRVKQVLIICPKFVADVWEQQLADHCPVPYEVYHWTSRERRHTGAMGGLPVSQPGKLLFIITNFEAFGTPGRKVPVRKKDGTITYRRGTANGRIHNRNLVRAWATPQSGITVDESHRIKSAGAAAARTIVTLQKDFQRRLIMTGTPITKASRAHDIYMQWKLLNPDRFKEWATLDDFKEHFGRWYKAKDVPVKLWKGSRNFEELQQLMLADAFVCDRDQCFDLPPVDIQIVPVELTTSAAIYDDMADKMVAYFRQHAAEASIPLVKVLRLAQITSGHVTTDKGEIVQVGREKIDALLPLVSQALDNGERIVIAARFRPSLNQLYDEIRALSKALPMFEIRGGMKKEWVTEDLITARRTRGPLVYIVQPRAASLGIDMSFCSRMIWHSLTNSFVDFTQCCDRIALSRQSTTFTHLNAGGIDQLLYDVLSDDGQVARAIIRNPERLLRDQP